MGIDHVRLGAGHVAGGFHLREVVLGRDHAVLGFAPLRAPAAVSDAEFDGGVKPATVSAGLTTGDNLGDLMVPG